MKSKVISIGNISMGGTGKTPHTIAIAQEYMQRGEKVAVLSLGYKGKLGYGMNVISDGRQLLHKPPQAADEPYMMALNLDGVPVITGKNRSVSLEYAEKEFGTTLTILDDAFQHKKIRKNVEIVLLDHKNPISTGFPFPFGYLREFPSGIKRADIVIFTRAESDVIPDKVKRYIDGKPVYFSNTVPESIVFEGSVISTDKLRASRVAAYSAIASNNMFADTLTKLGADICIFKGFPDHAAVSENVINEILTKGKAEKIDFFLTTEKDYVKLSENLKKQFGFLKLGVEIKEKIRFYIDIDKFLCESNLA